MDLLAKLNKKITRLQYISKVWQEELQPVIESMIKNECNEVEKFILDYKESYSYSYEYFFLYITAQAEDGFDSHTERIGYNIKDIKENGFDSPYDFCDFLSDVLNDSLKEDNKEEIPELFPGMNEMMDDLTIRK